MPALLLTFIVIAVSAIAIWVSAWTYIRWQRIWKNREKDWFNKLFWITTIIAAVAIAALIIVWAINK